MYIRLFLAGAFALMLSCKKDKEEDKKSATDLLTQKDWVLKGYGYDENDNGVLDPNENNIGDCEKDNTYLFSRNGAGSHFENTLLCGTGIGEAPFTWKWLNNETTLQIGFAEINVLRLNENDFIFFLSITFRYYKVYNGIEALRQHHRSQKSAVVQEDRSVIRVYDVRCTMYDFSKSEKSFRISAWRTSYT